MGNLQQKISVLGLFCFLLGTRLFATHGVGGDISYQCLGGNQYAINLSIYRDCSASFGYGSSVTINASSASCGINTNLTATQVGTAQEVSAICPAQLGNTTCSGGGLPGVDVFNYTVIYTLPQNCTDWVFSWNTCCRNYAITTGPSGNSMYIQATLNSVAATCNNSPTFTSLPVPYFCAGQAVNYNHGAVDVDGDSLVFTLVDPYQSANSFVTYNAPYYGGYPLATTPANTFNFSPSTGQMAFTPAGAAQTVLAVLVEEYRNGVLIGSVIRDIQVIVINCTNGSPTISPVSTVSGGSVNASTGSIQVCTGSTLSFNVGGTEPSSSTVLSMTANNNSSAPGSSFVTAGTNPVTGTFTWTPTGADMGFHNLTITLTDNACPIPSIQTIPVLIEVVGVDLSASNYNICPGTVNTIQLDASLGGNGSGTGTYSWSPATGLSCTNCPNPIATVSSGMTYTVTYSDASCVSSDNVVLTPVGGVVASPQTATQCPGTSLQLDAVSTFTNLSTGCGLNNAPCSGPINTLTVGTATTNTGTGTTSGGVGSPYMGWWMDGRVQYLFTAAELSSAGVQAGLLRSIAFNVTTKSSTAPYNNFTIKLGCTNVSSLTAYQTGTSQVYTGTVSTVLGWNTHNFTTPYEWDGVSNLIVEVCYDNTAYTYYDQVAYTGTSFTSVGYARTDNSSGCGLTSFTSSTQRANMRFTNCVIPPPVAFAWNALNGSGNASLSATNISNPIANPSLSTQYEVAATYGSCTVRDTVQVNMANTITLNPISPITSCANTANTLSVTGTNLGGATFTWNPGALSGQTVSVSPSTTTTYTVTATNPCSSTSQSVTVTVSDTQAPTITGCPSNITANTDAGQCGANVSWTAPSITDNCPTINVSASHSSGAFFPIGTTTVTYTATDFAGNVSTCSFNVTVSDNENPSISNCPSNISVNVDAGTCGAIVTWAAPSASDNCSVSSFSSSHASGAIFPIGTTLVTYTATDAAGNSAVCSFSITVSDNENPIITNCPANITLNANAGTCDAVATWLAPSASDNCAVSSFSSTHSSGASFPLGTTTVTYTAIDAAGNTATCSFTVSVTDNLASVINNCPANISVNAAANACGANVSWVAPSATDNCLLASFSPTAASGSFFPLGTTTVTYTATDAAGNTSTCSFTVNVTDNTPPTISNCPSNMVVSTDLGQCSAVVNWATPSVTDNCAGSTLSSSISSGSSFNVGTHTVTYTATDAAGLTSTCSFTITVNDNESPVINCPANISAIADATCQAVVSWITPSASDNCSLLPLSATHSSGASFPIGTTTVTYTATDVNGNATTCSFDIVVNPPALLSLNPQVLNNVSCNGFADGSATVSVSNGSGSYSYSWSPSAQSTQGATGLNAGTYTVYVTDLLAPCVPQASATLTITEPSALALSLNGSSDVTCFAGTNGSATVSASGGTSPYSYAWNTNPPQNTANATNLSAGTYQVTLTDDNTCTTTLSVSISEPSQLQASEAHTEVLCFGGNNAEIDLTITGGTPNYTINWTGGLTGINPTNLTAGTYTANISDANGCSLAPITVNITEPSAPLSVNTTQTDIVCYGQTNGTANAIATGGTAPYTYTWNTSPVSYNSSISGLDNRSYTVTVKDANGCISTASLAIQEPTAVQLAVVEINHAYCDLPNGEATVLASGGNAGFTYTWNTTPPSYGANIGGLLEGTYLVTAVDVLGCSYNRSISIQNTPPSTALFTSVPDNSQPILLGDATIQFLNASQGASSQVWDFGDNESSTALNATHTFTSPGTYTVQLTTYNGFADCPANYTLVYEILPDGQLFLPNAFTPNGDGHNDEFKALGEGIVSFEMRIYDRWGKLFKTLNSLQDGWNGSDNNGEDAPEGVYTYSVKATYNDGRTLERAGTITLIR